MPLFLRATNTANFTILTSSRLYDFYPTLKSRRINVTSGTWCNGSERTARYFCGLRSHFGTSKWQEPCGEACPNQPRFTKGMKGVGIARWGGVDRELDTGDSVSVGHALEASNFMWRMGDWCRNSYCPNYNRRINILF